MSEHEPEFDEELVETIQAADARGVDLEAAGATADALLAQGVDPTTAVEAAIELHDLSGLNEVDAADKIASRKGWT
jgi:hypothetical protein